MQIICNQGLQMRVLRDELEVKFLPGLPRQYFIEYGRFTRLKRIYKRVLRITSSRAWRIKLTEVLQKAVDRDV